MKLEGANIMVTGGCGLIGSTTIDRLLDHENPGSITILDNLSRGSMRNVERILQDPRVTLVRGDIRDKDVVLKATEGKDAVIHFAAIRITACAADTREAMEVMCDGTFNVVDAAHRQGVKKILAASSASVYGLADTFPTTEEHHPYNNRTWYGASKVMLEGLLRSYADMYGTNYVATRYFNVYGPRMDIHGKYTEVLIRWMERIANGQPPIIFGDGTDTMDFINVGDIARANVLGLKSDATDEVFNIASGEETSLKQLALALMKVMGAKGADLEFGPARSVNPVSRRLADISKAEKMLGFKAEISLEQGLEQLVQWWRANREHIAA
jgi:UDP-glucose 4-epimerase